MINANELRIGNLIKSPNGEVFKVDNIQVNSINQRIDGDGVAGSYFLSGFTGIELTPEVLEKCGFEKERHYVVKGSIYVFENNYVALYPEEGREEINLPHIKYLHQLQNLVFALTGNELDYKP